MLRIIPIQQLLLIVVISLMSASCDYSSNDNKKVTKLEVALPETRTMMGEKVGDTYPVYWSEGDRLVVNGILSKEVEIDASNRSYATFEVEGDLNYPLSLIYPYSSATAPEAPVVEFQSEQTYVKGSFAEGCAPMCGYVTSENELVTMKHLAGVLKFAIKASSKDVVLQKIVVTSTSGAKLSGAFSVDCATATLSATEQTKNSVTYILPADFKLSEKVPAEFFISIPAVEVGSCKVEFVELSGDKMECSWNPSSAIKGGIVREFKLVSYLRSTDTALDEVALPPFEDGATSKVFRLRAMSYNVRNCIGLDGVVDDKRTAEVIAGRNLDVVALQELDSITTRRPLYVLQRLANLTGMHPTFGAAINLQGGKYGVGVLTKEKPLSYYRVPLPCSSEPRVLLVVELENYYFCCTHFSLLGEYRVEAAKIIIEEAKKLNKPMILAGDFNDRRGSQALSMLAEHFHFYEKEGSVNTYPADNPAAEIDYIVLYKGNGAEAVVNEHWVPFVTVASDHRPVLIDMTVCE